jgi:hypothetical protein
MSRFHQRLLVILAVIAGVFAPLAVLAEDVPDAATVTLFTTLFGTVKATMISLFLIIGGVILIVVLFKLGIAWMKRIGKA